MYNKTIFQTYFKHKLEHLELFLIFLADKVEESEDV